MTSTEVPVNRTLVGILAIVCGLLGSVTYLLTDPSGGNLWPGAFLRVGTVLGAFWLALPSRTREAAWARVPLWNVVGVVLGLLVIVRTRLPLKLLIPAVIVFGAVYLLLRPRPKTRPKGR